MLEDLIVAAVNEALTQVDQAAAGSMSKLNRRHEYAGNVLIMDYYSSQICETDRRTVQTSGHWSEVCAASGISPDPYA